jgi:4-hydroxybenzoate polyprenyltransferase
VQRSGGGLRLLAAVVTLPWMLGYGVTGAWAVTRGARGVAAGVENLDVGYTRLVTPAGVIYVGALLLTAFAVLLACSLLLVYDRRSPVAWIPVLFVSAGLSAGAAWAAARGSLDPGLWLLFFFGLVYVAVVAAVRIVRVTRGARPLGLRASAGHQVLTSRHVVAPQLGC